MKKRALIISVIIFILSLILSFLLFFYLTFNNEKIRMTVIHSSLLSENKDIKNVFLEEIGVAKERFDDVTLNTIFDEYIISLAINEVNTVISREALNKELSNKKIVHNIPDITKVEKKISSNFDKVFRNKYYLLLKKQSHNKVLYYSIAAMILSLYIILVYTVGGGVEASKYGTYIAISLSIVVTALVFLVRAINFESGILSILLNNLIRESFNSVSIFVILYFLITASFAGYYFIIGKIEREKKYVVFEELGKTQKINIYNDEEIISKRLDNIILNSDFHIKGDHEGYIIDNKHALYKYEIVYVKEEGTLNDKVYIFKYSDKIDVDDLYNKIKYFDYSNLEDKYLINVKLKKINVNIENKLTYDKISEILEDFSIENRKDN